MALQHSCWSIDVHLYDTTPANLTHTCFCITQRPLTSAQYWEPSTSHLPPLQLRQGRQCIVLHASDRTAHTAQLLLAPLTPFGLWQPPGGMWHIYDNQCHLSGCRHCHMMQVNTAKWYRSHLHTATTFDTLTLVALSTYMRYCTSDALQSAQESTITGRSCAAGVMPAQQSPQTVA